MTVDPEHQNHYRQPYALSHVKRHTAGQKQFSKRWRRLPGVATHPGVVLAIPAISSGDSLMSTTASHMKYHKTLFALVASLLLSLSSDAASFDTEGFGNDLNGWTKKKNSATEYKSAESLYRTYKPTLFPAPDGTLLISTTIDHLRGWEGDDRCQLKMTFDKNGQITSSCVVLTMAPYSFNTGIVTAPASLAGAAAGTTALNALGTEISKKLQDQIGKWNEKGGRANLPAVVRQNLDLVAKHVKP